MNHRNDTVPIVSLDAGKTLPENMKVLHLNTFDGSIGGADGSAFRIHRCLVDSSVNSLMLVQHKEKLDDTIVATHDSFVKMRGLARAAYDALPVLRYPNWDRKAFFPQRTPNRRLENLINEIDPDVIHLHWIQRGYLSVEALSRLRKYPIVWTMHDQWAFTGGCYYSHACSNYEQNCGQCPNLGSIVDLDLSRKTMMRKENIYKNLNLTLVGASRWLQDSAQQSSLSKHYQTEVIPYPMDTDMFLPQDKKEERKKLGLDLNKSTVLFGAANIEDPRKGLEFLAEAVLQLSDAVRANLQVVTFGSGSIEGFDFGDVTTVSLGSISIREQLPAIYSSADVFIAPSLADNLPNTVIEALCCGVPVIGFEVGGVPDMVTHQENGWLAPLKDTNGLTQGMDWCLKDKQRLEVLSNAARARATKQFAASQIANQYIELYKRVMSI